MKCGATTNAAKPLQYKALWQFVKRGKFGWFDIPILKIGGSNPSGRAMKKQPFGCFFNEVAACAVNEGMKK